MKKKKQKEQKDNRIYFDCGMTILKSCDDCKYCLTLRMELIHGYVPDFSNSGLPMFRLSHFCWKEKQFIPDHTQIADFCNLQKKHEGDIIMCRGRTWS